MPSAMDLERTAMHARFAKFAQTDASPIAHCGSWPTDNAPRLASRPSRANLASDGTFCWEIPHNRVIIDSEVTG